MGSEKPEQAGRARTGCRQSAVPGVGDPAEMRPRGPAHGSGRRTEPPGSAPEECWGDRGPHCGHAHSQGADGTGNGRALPHTPRGDVKMGLPQGGGVWEPWSHVATWLSIPACVHPCVRVCAHARTSPDMVAQALELRVLGATNSTFNMLWLNLHAPGTPEGLVTHGFLCHGLSGVETGVPGPGEVALQPRATLKEKAGWSGALRLHSPVLCVWGHCPRQWTPEHPCRVGAFGTVSRAAGAIVSSSAHTCLPGVCRRQTVSKGCENRPGWEWGTFCLPWLLPT